MTLSPRDIAKAQSLLEERTKLVGEKQRAGGHTDVTVHGRYYGSLLNEAEMDAMIAIMEGLFTRLIADVDAELLTIGVSMEPTQ